MTRRDPRDLAAAAVALALCVIAFAGRLGEWRRPTDLDAAPSRGALFCAGVKVGEDEPGIACAFSRDSFFVEAVRAGFAPKSCGAVLPPLGLRAGRLAVLEERNGVCSAIEIRPLPGAAALLCGARIDVNRASEKELELLPGIGPARAEAIAESRREDGPFLDVEDLDRVPGIGEKTLERLEKWIEVEE